MTYILKPFGNMIMDHLPSLNSYRTTWISGKRNPDAIDGFIIYWNRLWFPTVRILIEVCMHFPLIRCHYIYDVLQAIISLLFLLLATLPASRISAEMSFSCLRRLKTYLHSRLTEERGTKAGAAVTIWWYCWRMLRHQKHLWFHS